MHRLSFLAVPLLFACDNESPNVAITASQYAAVLANTFCRDLEACCNARERSWEYEITGGCEQERARILSWGEEVEDAAARGTLSFDSAKAASCAAQLEARTCDGFARETALSTAIEYRSKHASCEGMITPRLHRNDSCQAHAECDGSCTESSKKCSPRSGECGDFFCDSTTFCRSDDTGTKSCLPRRGDGEGCEYDDVCASSFCFEGQCRPPVRCNGINDDEAIDPLWVCEHQDIRPNRTLKTDCVWLADGPLQCTCDLNNTVTTCEIADFTPPSRYGMCTSFCCAD